MPANNRIGSQRIVAPQYRRTPDQENIAPRQPQQRPGRQPRARQAPFKDLAPMARAPLQARNLNIGASPPQPRPQPKAAPAKPHSVRTPGHGVAASTAIQNHSEIVRRQIEALGRREGASATGRPQQVMTLLNARIPELPDAKSIGLLRQLQVILSLPNQASRNSHLAMFVANNRLIAGAAVAKPAPAPTPAPARQVARPAPMRQAARPAPSPARAPQATRPASAPQAQPAQQRIFKSFQDLATQGPFARPARPAQPARPSRPTQRYDDFKPRDGAAPARSRPAATAAPLRTASAPPQYGRTASIGAEPTQQPILTIGDFIRFAQNDAEQESMRRYSMPEIYEKAQKNFDAYLTRLEGRTEPQPRPARTQSAPPRMQTLPAARMDTSWHDKVNQETDDRNRYHHETGGHRYAQEEYAARQQPVSYSTTPRPRRTQSLPKLTAEQIESIKQFEDQRAHEVNEYPNHDEAVRRYKQQNGYR
ncbi:type III effector protein [Ralstonia pseudosolanacearum]|uniref:Type III effector protein n=1 Tax=Ralstonia solanacearum TaxID=305 RepID=A0AA92K5M8_RALSL|nr:type III effector protein [Ralstonia pseudosolanacearum]QOK98483.1 type III effector protein [Ralstonia pseudosolanacearum]